MKICLSFFKTAYKLKKEEKKNEHVIRHHSGSLSFKLPDNIFPFSMKSTFTGGPLARLCRRAAPSRQHPNDRSKTLKPHVKQAVANDLPPKPYTSKSAASPQTVSQLITSN